MLLSKPVLHCVETLDPQKANEDTGSTQTATYTS